ncbi:MAG: hypothetical protein NC393_08500 [Clostridium sp.]|nr:hypothetical protein [Clostridium sp.]MCM1207712.1 hypothetical protein [Ruminococcus sp.]
MGLNEELQIKLNNAISLFQNQENVECIRVLKEILEVNSDCEAALVLMGQVSIRLNLYDVAERFLLKAFTINNQNGEIYACLGNVEHSRGNFENAYGLYSYAIELGIEDISLYLNIGLIAEEIENYDVALEVYDRALFMEPDNIAVFRKIVDILYRNGEFMKAVEICSEFIGVNAQIYDGYTLKLSLLEDLQKFDLANETLEQAKMYFENTPEYIFDVIRLKKQEKRFDEAFSVLEENYEKIKHLEELYFLEKANILSLLDKVEEAQLIYDDLRIRYANREAIFALQMIYLKKSDFSISMALAEELIAISVRDNIYYYSLFFKCFASIVSEDKSVYLKECSTALEIMNEVDGEDVEYVFLYILRASIANVLGSKKDVDRDVNKIKQWKSDFQLIDITASVSDDFH